MYKIYDLQLDEFREEEYQSYNEAVEEFGSMLRGFEEDKGELDSINWSNKELIRFYDYEIVEIGKV